MILFINDRPVRFKEQHELFELNEQYNEIDASVEKFSPLHLFGHVLIKNTPLSYIRSFYNHVKTLKRTHFDSITFIVPDKRKAKNLTKSFYTIVKAAGGIIKNDADELLMIHRLGKWDLPKGKMDKGEVPRQTAVREVEEECNIKVKLHGKACTSWHTYTFKGKSVLKQTKWYYMTCLDDSEMKPQQEEDIEDIQWMDSAKVEAAILNTYVSIIYVLTEGSVLKSNRIELF
ncbi:ADP-ribose pyrophosphatase YjhB, NUDIX family [Spirosomataceae bacterium TFI 002]|nr:ADP-ribose pyrophosphatase YjhB, NUDIX family [Spirosomataceae bacterium TFI 002]